jgi:hypothetical protein
VDALIDRVARSQRTVLSHLGLDELRGLRVTALVGDRQREEDRVLVVTP